MVFDPDIGKATRWRKGQPSPNPGGRPRSRLLSEALRHRLSQMIDDTTGRTFAEAIADNLVRIACSEGPSAVHAANEIADRIEGRAPQSIQISDLAADLQSRSDEELEFHLQHGRWPSDTELALLRQPVEPTQM